MRVANILTVQYYKTIETFMVLVLYPGEGECADPVNEDAILEREGGGEPQDRNGKRQLASDTGGGKT
jgi:hypothetical protein